MATKSKGKRGKKAAALGNKKSIKQAAKKQTAKKKPAKARAAKKGSAHALNAKKTGAHAALPITRTRSPVASAAFTIAAPRVQLWDAICHTPTCPTPVLARGVNPLKATNAARQHLADQPLHDVEVVPEA